MEMSTPFSRHDEDFTVPDSNVLSDVCCCKRAVVAAAAVATALAACSPPQWSHAPHQDCVCGPLSCECRLDYFLMRRTQRSRFGDCSGG